MYKYLLSGLGAMLLAITLGSAQQTCGTYGEMEAAMIERLIRNKQSFRQNPGIARAPKYVPVKFHLVAKSDGTGRIAELDVLKALCEVNEDFAPVDFHFYIKNGFNYINNTTVYSSHTATINSIMSLNRASNALNVFVVDDATPANGSIGTTLGYYSPGTDWIVIKISELKNANSTTFAHELGHFFSLPHPHRGWDDDPWDADTHGNPAPTNSPGGVPTELMDGSNCETAGDLICDTPPDYNFGFGWQSCTYNGGAKDPDGVVVDPEEKLFMGYFDGCAADDYFFSDMQQAMMIQDINSFPRNYLQPNSNPGLQEVTEAPVLEYPNADQVLTYYENVPLDWEAVPGADKYLLEVSRLPTFSISVFTGVVTESSQTIEGLEPDKVYYWRVKAYNNQFTCAPSSEVREFSTGSNPSAVSTISAVNTWSISPNPGKSGENLRIAISAVQPFQAQAKLFNLNGQLINAAGIYRVNAGENQFNYAIGSIPAGVYLFSLESEQGRLTSRIVVTQ